MARRFDQSALFRYGIAVVSVAGAALLTRVLSGLGDSGISPQFFAAVLISAWYGGRGPGLLATLLSGVAAAGLLIVPESSASAVRDAIFRAAMLTVIALVTSSLHSATRRALRAAKSASADKDRFLAMISHELLTPLSPILVATELLLDDPKLPPHMLADLETIRRNLMLETRLVNDLLDLSRLAAGKLQIHLDRVDVHHALREAVQLCQPEIEDRQQRLTTSLDAKTFIVQADTLRLQQVLWNLLGNAIKFAGHGGTIAIKTEDDGQLLKIEVADSGIGIAPEHLSSIFEAFEQGDPDTASLHGGLGLGLAISRSLIVAQGGRIRAMSKGRGCGATFILELPLDGVAAASAINSEAT